MLFLLLTRKKERHDGMLCLLFAGLSSNSQPLEAIEAENEVVSLGVQEQYRAAKQFRQQTVER